MSIIHVRSRTPYFNVPPSQQPLRVRDGLLRPPRPTIEPRANCLEQLVIGSLFHPLDPDLLPEPDRAELLDAVNECEHGRLAGDRTAPCGCWPNEPTMQPVHSPDLIPDWVLTDARYFYGTGMTVRWIAREILPATGCPDVPSCERELTRALDLRAGQTAPSSDRVALPASRKEP